MKLRCGLASLVLVLFASGAHAMIYNKALGAAYWKAFGNRGKTYSFPLGYHYRLQEPISTNTGKKTRIGDCCHFGQSGVGEFRGHFP